MYFEDLFCIFLHWHTYPTILYESKRDSLTPNEDHLRDHLQIRVFGKWGNITKHIAVNQNSVLPH